MELTELTITDAARELRRKTFSAVELTTAVMDRIEEHNPVLNAFLFVDRVRSLASARRADQALRSGDPPPMTGIPIALKDNILYRNAPTTAGSKLLASYIAPYDATVVERLRDAGAVFVGKTNLDEFAMGSSGENSAYGSAKNPWDTRRVPGGSSSGSAAAVSASLALGSLGSDTAGSVRIPAGFTNLVGVKPTYGRVSRHGLIALGSSPDVIGTFTHTVEDAYAMYRVIAGHDARDATTSSTPLPDSSLAASDTLDGVRIGVPETIDVAGIDPSLIQLFHAAVEHVRTLGADVRTVALPDPEPALAAYYIILPAEVSSNLARYDGVRYAPSGEPSAAVSFHDAYVSYRTKGFGPEVKRRLMLGTYVLSHGYHDRYYTKAQQVRARVTREYERVFEGIDCLLTPTSPTVAFRFGEKGNNPLTMYLSDIFTVSANIAGLPAMSIPGGFHDRLPVGLQLVGPQYGEMTLFRVAAAYQRATDWHTRRPARADTSE